MTPIHGTTDTRFQAVRDAFAANFRDHGEVGAALCVYRRGRRIHPSNGITTARAIARLYNALIDPTDNYPLLTPWRDMWGGIGCGLS